MCTHIRECRVGQNYIIYIRCTYDIIGRVITKCAVIYAACIHTLLVSPGHVPLVCANTFADSIVCPYTQLHICTLAVKHTHTHIAIEAHICGHACTRFDFSASVCKPCMRWTGVYIQCANHRCVHTVRKPQNIMRLSME